MSPVWLPKACPALEAKPSPSCRGPVHAGLGAGAREVGWTARLPGQGQAAGMEGRGPLPVLPAMPTASRHLFRRHQAQLWQRGRGSSPQTPPLAPTSTRPGRVLARPWLKTKTKTEQRGSCRQPTPRSPRPGSPLTTFLPFNPAVTRNGQATLSLSQPPPLCLQEQTVLAWDVPTRQDVSSGTPSLCVHRAGSEGQGQRQDRAQVLRPGPRTLCCSRGDPGSS